MCGISKVLRKGRIRGFLSLPNSLTKQMRAILEIHRQRTSMFPECKEGLGYNQCNERQDVPPFSKGISSADYGRLIPWRPDCELKVPDFNHLREDRQIKRQLSH